MKREELAGRTNFLNKTKRIAKQTTRELPTGAEGEGGALLTCALSSNVCDFPALRYFDPLKVIYSINDVCGRYKININANWRKITSNRCFCFESRNRQ